MLQLLNQKLKNKSGALPLLVSGMLLFSVTPAMASPSWCANLMGKQAVSFGLQKERQYFPHSARHIGDQMTMENLRRNILDLSGRFPVDEKGCLGDRCTERNKDRYIDYLQRRMASWGIANYLEQGIYSDSGSNKEEKKRSINNNPGAGPLDFSVAEPGFVKTLFSTKKTKLIARFLRDIGLNFDLHEYKKINLEMINALLEVAKNPGPQIGPMIKFQLNINHLTFTKSEFFKNQGQRKELIEQLDQLKTRIMNGNIARAENDRVEKDAKNPKPVVKKRADIINVIAEIPGTLRPDQIIEVSAHYDTIDPDHPGADDNGSGLSTMLEMIRIFKTFRPERTIRFVFTDLEERGMQGSSLHVQQVKKRGDNLLGALMIDTIGYHPLRESGDKPVFVLELGTPSMRPTDAGFKQASAFADVIAWQFARYERYVRMSVETIDAMPGTADHGPYFRADLPGLLAAAPYEGDFINPGYHKKTDTIEQYNWLYFTEIARAMTEAIAVASGAKISEHDIKNIDPELLAYYKVQYKDVSPNKDHKAVVHDKGGRKFGGGYKGGGSSRRSSSSSNPWTEMY